MDIKLRNTKETTYDVHLSVDGGKYWFFNSCYKTLEEAREFVAANTTSSKLRIVKITTSTKMEVVE